jgi:hypothetical protein
MRVRPARITKARQACPRFSRQLCEQILQRVSMVDAKVGQRVATDALHIRQPLNRRAVVAESLNARAELTPRL